MQATMSRPISRSSDKRPGASSMGRAFKYLSHAKRQALLPYLFLVIATLAQLAIPALIASIINAVTSGYIATQVLQALNQIPQQFMSTALPNILSALNYPAAWTKDQLVAQLNANLANAPQALIWSVVAICIFAAFRGVFAFLQAFWAEKNSQSVAYDLRNDLYSKI